MLFLENPRIHPKWNAETPWLMGKETSLFSCKSNNSFAGEDSSPPGQGSTLFCLCPSTPPRDTVHPLSVSLFKKNIKCNNLQLPLKLYLLICWLFAPTLCLTIEREFFKLCFVGSLFQNPHFPSPPQMHQRHDSLLRTRQCRAF